MFSERRVGTLVLTAALTWGLAGCGNSSPTGLGGGAGSGAPISFSVGVGGANGLSSITAPSGAMFDLVLSDGSSSLTITRVGLVLREVELKLANEICEDSSDGVDSDLCEEFKTGPSVFELPVDSTVKQMLAISDVPAGSYDGLEFKVHKASSSSDSAFVAANPDFADISIRVEGSYQGQPFTFVTSVEAENEIDFATPIVVADASTAPVNVTLMVDVDGWFRDAAGNLIDPASAGMGGANESLVAGNIKNSFRGFEDDDEDGIED